MDPKAQKFQNCDKKLLSQSNPITINPTTCVQNDIAPTIVVLSVEGVKTYLPACRVTVQYKITS